MKFYTGINVHNAKQWEKDLAIDRTFWSAPGAWPKGNSANIFLAAALHNVGRALFHDDWQENDPVSAAEFFNEGAAMIQMASRRTPEPLPLPVPLSLADRGANWNRTRDRNVELERQRATQDWHIRTYRANRIADVWQKHIERLRGPRDRVQAAMEWIQERACEGSKLPTRWRRVAGGAFIEASSAIWNLESLWSQRFRRSQLRHGGVDFYLFLDRAALARELSRLGSAQIVSKANHEQRAKEWLREQFADEATTAFTRTDFKRIAVTQFEISGEGFGRIWGEVVRDFPARSKPGARRAN